jgi:hypothetical protein
MGSSQKSSFGYTVSNSGIGNVRDTLNNHYRNDDTNSTKCGGTLYIRRFIYNYKAVGSHRYIELRFDCGSCNYSKWVRTDKTSNGNKNISIADGPYNSEDGWWYWDFNPKYSYSFSDFEKMFDDAPSGYHLTKNNCADYARYFWKRID